MHKLLLHSMTEADVAACIAHPSHAVVLAGPTGVGKKSLALHIASQCLDIHTDALSKYPYFRLIENEGRAAITIDEIRSLKTFVSLKIPGDRPVARIILICDAHTMTTEAQNALLKLLEEPPLDTLLLLTVSHMESLLDTVRSRTRLLTVTPPTPEDAGRWFERQNHDTEAIRKCLMLSGGLPGLMQALLADEVNHPLYAATTQARDILGGKTFDRLLLVDSLSKDKNNALDVLFILGQMARITLLRTNLNGTDMDRWQKILSASYRASELLRRNVQSKLVLTNLMLEL